LEKVGAVFALEASRLSRSCSDWHRLLEICAFTGTLLIDEDGCYDPADFNDQLLLGLKGTMSQAELHFIRARLQGGKRNKARRGELRFPLPVGYVYGEEPGSVLIDPDQEVRCAVELIFELFRQTGSAYGVVRHFAQHQLRFPKRSYGGVWNGKLLWGNLKHSRVLGVLNNPCLCGSLCFWPVQIEQIPFERRPNPVQGAQTANRFLERADPGPSSPLHQLAAVFGEPTDFVPEPKQQTRAAVA
jgi:DNA invertase Pin-like site-specific DNA recombinase